MSNGTQKKLVIYFSLDGNTKYIAKNIARSVKADLAEIQPVKKINNKSSLKYLFGGMQALFKKKPKIMLVAQLFNVFLT